MRRLLNLLIVFFLSSIHCKVKAFNVYKKGEGGEKLGLGMEEGDGRMEKGRLGMNQGGGEKGEMRRRRD